MAQASWTAVLAGQGRAVADGRIGQFRDPTAMPLLRPDEQEQVEAVRAEQRPTGMGNRMTYQMVESVAHLMVPRTLAIDRAVDEHPAPQVVVLGAGLDGRAWRMPALAGKQVFEVDQPASQRDKQDRAAALDPDRAPHFVPVDFTGDTLAEGLDGAGHRADLATTWVWEGVVPYLTRSEVETTVAAVAARSTPGSRLVVNYQTPSFFGAVARGLLGAALTAARRHNPWSAEPWRSAWSPSGMSKLLATHGFVVRDDQDMESVATALGLSAPPAQRASQRNSRVAVADKP